MLTTYNQDTILLIKKFQKTSEEIKRGMIITFSSQKYQNQTIIKRVIGLPRENIKINDQGIVFINDNQLQEPYVTLKPNFEIPNEWRLNKDECFVLGDNRIKSLDSRRLGPINKDEVTGKVKFKIWPLFKK